MKLVNTEHQININFFENVQTVLVIENFNEFQKIIMHLQEQYINQYDKFYLSENGRSLSFPKFVDIVMDIFTLQLNSKKIQNYLYRLASDAANEFETEKSDILSASITFMDKICSKINCMEVDYDTIFSYNDFFKLFNFKIRDSDIDLTERISTYIKVISEISDAKILVFINLKSFISSQQLSEIYNVAFAYKIHLLLIESSMSYNMENEQFYIIDSQLCVIN